MELVKLFSGALKGVPLDLQSVTVVALSIFVAYYFYTVTMQPSESQPGTQPMRICAQQAPTQRVAAPPSDPAAPTRQFTLDDLTLCRGYGGQEKNNQGFSAHQILLCVNGEVYDVTSHPSGIDFYGPGKSYHIFAGRDATVPLGRMEIKEDLCNRVELWETLTTDQRKVLADWIKKFRSKYTFVGTLRGSAEKRLDLSDFSCPPPVPVLPE